jgi:hypothetical protein
MVAAAKTKESRSKTAGAAAATTKAQGQQAAPTPRNGSAPAGTGAAKGGTRLAKVAYALRQLLSKCAAREGEAALLAELDGLLAHAALERVHLCLQLLCAHCQQLLGSRRVVHASMITLPG